MSSALKTEISIPDNWYDFYTRLLPGTYFIAVIRVANFNRIDFPDLYELLVLLGASYLLGFIVQPFSLMIFELIKKRVKVANYKSGDDFVNEIKHRLGRENRDSLILSKMHAEALFYLQCSIFSLILVFLNWVLSGCVKNFHSLGLCYLCSLLAAFFLLIFFSYKVFTELIYRAENIEKMAIEGFVILKQVSTVRNTPSSVVENDSKS